MTAWVLGRRCRVINGFLNMLPVDRNGALLNGLAVDGDRNRDLVEQRPQYAQAACLRKRQQRTRIGYDDYRLSMNSTNRR